MPKKPRGAAALSQASKNKGELYKRLEQITKDPFETMSMHEVEVTFQSMFDKLKSDFPCANCDADCRTCGCKGPFFKASWEKLFGEKEATR